MNLSILSNVQFNDGPYTIGTKAGNSIIVRNIVIDNNVLIADRVALEQIDSDEGKVYLAGEEIVRIEFIPQGKFLYMKSYSDRTLQQRELESMINHANTVEVARKAGILPAPQQTMPEEVNGDHEQSNIRPIRPRIAGDDSSKARVISVPPPGV